MFVISCLVQLYLLKLHFVSIFIRRITGILLGGEMMASFRFGAYSSRVRYCKLCNFGRTTDWTLRDSLLYNICQINVECLHHGSIVHAAVGIVRHSGQLHLLVGRSRSSNVHTCTCLFYCRECRKQRCSDCAKQFLCK